MAKDKSTHNDRHLQNTTLKTKDRVTRTPLKTLGWTQKQFYSINVE